jgi:hypothetical protein
MNIAKQLDAARAEVARLERRAAGATCAELGRHDWQHIGGRNAGCDLGSDCSCSVPVHKCSRCGDCDYGDNPEADDVRDECFALSDGR